MINQGDIYWCSVKISDETETLPHPYVVIQDTIINRSRIDTVVVCGITSNMKKAGWPGIVLLDPDEANLPQRSMIDVSQVSTIKKEQLGDFIGKLSSDRLSQVFSGMELIQGFQAGNSAEIR